MNAARKIDGREATLQARQYFEETLGQFGVFSFEVKSVKLDQEESLWAIMCSFERGISGERIHYQVYVREAGGIDSVTKE